jgi:hypothetical protein
MIVIYTGLGVWGFGGLGVWGFSVEVKELYSLVYATLPLGMGICAQKFKFFRDH